MYKRYLYCLLLVCTVGVFLTACDQSSQNIDYQVGKNLTVDGPGTLVVPNYGTDGTAEYIVKAFTINKDYSWSVDGATLKTTKRQGEVAVVATSDTSAAYTVTVETTVDGKKTTGSASGAATYPSASSQIGKFGLSMFQSAASATGVLSSQAKRGQTIFAPTNGAFLGALDANGDSTLSDAEMPPDRVLAQVLRYHVVTDGAYRSADVTSGTQPTALGEDVTFNSGTVEGVASTAATNTDIASNSAALVSVDNVLLPSTAVSINDQTVDRDGNVDSVAVAGTFVSESNGSFVAIHAGSASGDIIGSSDELSSGFHGSQAGPFKIELDQQLTQDTTLVAMPHRDAVDDGVFVPSNDGPYMRGGAPVTDDAAVAVP